MDWYSEAQRAVRAYRTGRRYKDYPEPGAVGYCARAARALWSACHGGRWFPYGGIDADGNGEVSALDMRLLIKRAGLLTTATAGGNAYHAAVAKGLIKPGAFLFLPYSRWGHVVVVVAVTGNPAASLRHVLCFENTRSVRDDGRAGTRLTRLDVICGPMGSGRVDGVYAP